MKKLITTSLTLTALATNAEAMDYEQLETVFGEPVTMSASGTPQRVSEAPVSMDIITYKDIQTSGAKDIPQLLMRLAGVQVQRPAIGGAIVSIRGYNRPLNNRVLVLINGRELNNLGYGDVNWDGLPISLNEIRQIEVVKGPNSSLFGFAAQTGVINILTFQPIFDNVSEMSVELGTHQRQQVEFFDTAQFGNHATRFSVGELASNGYDSDKELGSSDNHVANHRFNIDHQWRIDDENKLRLQLGYSNSEAYKFTAWTGRPHDKNIIKSYHLTYDTENAIGPFTFDIYRSEGSERGQTILSEANTVFAKVQQLKMYNGKHTLRATAEYKSNYLQSNFITPQDDKMEYQSFAPSIMWNYQVTDKTNTALSVRYDRAEFNRTADATTGNFIDADFYDRVVEEISYNASVNHMLDNKNSIRVSTARGMHIPSHIEYGVSFDLSSLGLIVQGNPMLEPERITSYEVAYDHNYTEDVHFKTAIFYQQMENIIGETITVGAPLSLDFSDLGDSESYGIEAGFTYNIPNGKFGANYTFMKVNDDPKGPLFYEDAQSEHQISAFAYKKFGRWDLSADIHYISESYKEYLSTAAVGSTLKEDNEGYTVLNANIGYNFSDALKLNVSGYNLIDSHHEWTGQQTGSDPNQNNSAIGPTAFAKLTYKF